MLREDLFFEKTRFSRTSSSTSATPFIALSRKNLDWSDFLGKTLKEALSEVLKEALAETLEEALEEELVEALEEA